MENEPDDEGESSPGPRPRRLKLPDEDWKEALRRALERERPAEESESDETESGDRNDGAYDGGQRSARAVLGRQKVILALDTPLGSSDRNCRRRSLVVRQKAATCSSSGSSSGM